METSGAAMTSSLQEQSRLNRLFFDFLGKDAGVEIVQDLERHFELLSMVKKHEGKVDPNATLINCGAYEVLSFIKQRIRFGEQNK